MAEVNKQVTQTEKKANNSDECVTKKKKNMDDVNWWKDEKFPVEF